MKPRRFFVRNRRGSSTEVFWRLDQHGGRYHALRPKGRTAACGLRAIFVAPNDPRIDPSDCDRTCLECADRVVRIVDPPKPVDLKRVLFRARHT